MRLITKYSKADVEALANQVIETEGDDEADFMVDILVQTATEMQMYQDYINTMGKWHFYLKNCLLEEDYELAQKIVRVIEIERNNFYFTIKEFCPWFIEEEDFVMVEHVITEMREIYGV